MAEITGAQSLIQSLESAGVDTVFGIPGGAILPAYDPMMDSKKLRHILVRHEQGAGHAACPQRRDGLALHGHRRGLQSHAWQRRVQGPRRP